MSLKYGFQRWLMLETVISKMTYRGKKLLQRWPVGEMIVSKMAYLRINSLNDDFSGINDFKDALSLIKGFQK